MNAISRVLLVLLPFIFSGTCSSASLAKAFELRDAATRFKTASEANPWTAHSQIQQIAMDISNVYRTNIQHLTLHELRQLSSDVDKQIKTLSKADHIASVDLTSELGTVLKQELVETLTSLRDREIPLHKTRVKGLAAAPRTSPIHSPRASTAATEGAKPRPPRHGKIARVSRELSAAATMGIRKPALAPAAPQHSPRTSRPASPRHRPKSPPAKPSYFTFTDEEVGAYEAWRAEKDPVKKNARDTHKHDVISAARRRALQEEAAAAAADDSGVW